MRGWNLDVWAFFSVVYSFSPMVLGESGRVWGMHESGMVNDR